MNVIGCSVTAGRVVVVVTPRGGGDTLTLHWIIKVA